MDLFFPQREEKREKPDIEFVSKKVPKKVDFDTKKKGRIMNYPPPNAQHRWLLRASFENGIEEYWTTFARPTMRQEDCTQNRFSYEQPMYQRGRQTWDDVYLEFRDLDMDAGIVSWVRQEGTTGHEYIPMNRREMTVEMVDPTGIVIEKWHLNGCVPKEVRFHQETTFDTPIIGISFSIDRAILIT